MPNRIRGGRNTVRQYPREKLFPRFLWLVVSASAFGRRTSRYSNRPCPCYRARGPDCDGRSGLEETAGLLCRKTNCNPKTPSGWPRSRFLRPGFLLTIGHGGNRLKSETWATHLVFSAPFHLLRQRNRPIDGPAGPLPQTAWYVIVGLLESRRATMERLAILGGSPVRTPPFTAGRCSRTKKRHASRTCYAVEPGAGSLFRASTPRSSRLNLPSCTILLMANA
jgi:hypothetical protein